MQFQRRFQNKKDELIQIMQQEIHKLNSELDGYKQFIKNYRDLEESFENNLKVIQELEQENTIVKQKANQLYNQLIEERTEVDRMREIIGLERIEKQEIINTTMKFEQTQSKLERMKQEMTSNENTLRDTIYKHQKTIIQLQSKHKIEIDKVSQLAAQTIASKQSQQQKNYYSFKTQTQKIISDLKHTNSMLLNENNQSNIQINRLKQEVLKLSTAENQKDQRLQRVIKQNQYNIQIYEKQMDSIKSSHDTYEITLKQKIQSLQAEKQKVVIELVEIKNIHKQKKKQLKEQFNKRMEQLAGEKSMQLKKCQDCVRDLQLEVSKAQYTIQQLRKDQLELERIKRSKAKDNEQKNNFYAKALQQDKKFFKNQLTIKQSKIVQLQQQVRFLEKQLHDQQVITNQLKAKQILAQQKQKQQSVSEQNVSIRDSQWQIQNKLPTNSLQLIALKRQKQMLQSQIAEMKNAIIKISKDSQQDIDDYQHKLSQKQKQINDLKIVSNNYKTTQTQKTNQIIILNTKINQQILNFERLSLSLKEIELLRQRQSDITIELNNRIKALEEQNNQLLEEINDMNVERDTLIQILNEKTAELENRSITAVEPIKRISISNISKISDEPRNIPVSPSFIEAVPQIPQRRGGALFDLIRQKKQRQRQNKMQINAKQSTLNQPIKRYFNQQIQSQKDVYSRLKSKSRSKSPQNPQPDIKRKFQQTNSQKQRFAQLKKDNQRKRAIKYSIQQDIKPKTGIDFNKLYDDQERRQKQQQVDQNDQ